MKPKTEIFDFNEKEHDKKIEIGKIRPVHLPRIESLSDVVKYQFCSEIILYKKEKKLQQTDIAKMININKSEVSRLFSYDLSKFSQERLMNFVEVLIESGANIDLDKVWERVKVQSNLLQRKLKKKKSLAIEARA